MNSFRHSEINTFGLRVWHGAVSTSYPPHRHNEMELNAIEEGFFTYVLAGQQVTVQAGEVALFWGAIPHQVIAFAPSTRVAWGTIPLEHVLRWDLPRSFVLALLGGRFFCDSQPLYTLTFFQQWEADMAQGRQALALMEMKALLFRFSQQAATTAVTDAPAWDQPTGRAHRMAALMSRRFQEALTVDDMAAVVGLHPNYAMTIFKETFGMSLIEYLTQQRIAHAQQLLITSDLNVSQIALDSGFQTLSHFYTAFQRLCGVAPGRYRAALRGKSDS